jgi:hypothetical protein
VPAAGRTFRTVKAIDSRKRQPGCCPLHDDDEDGQDEEDRHDEPAVIREPDDDE